MRTFYVFSVNNEFKNLTKNNSISLFETFDKIHFLINSNFDLAYNLFDTVICNINKSNKNKYLYLKNKDNLFYTYNNYYHQIYDYYNNENTKIRVLNTYIKIDTNVDFPNVIKDLTTYDNLFVCDFENKDYFWLSDIYNLVVA